LGIYLWNLTGTHNKNIAFCKSYDGHQYCNRIAIFQVRHISCEL
jgi:hypothetical protein